MKIYNLAYCYDRKYYTFSNQEQCCTQCHGTSHNHNITTFVLSSSALTFPNMIPFLTLFDKDPKPQSYSLCIYLKRCDTVQIKVIQFCSMKRHWW